MPLIKKSPAAKLLAAMAALALTSSPAFAATQTWDGAASSVWDTSALNWGGAPFTSTNDALFTGTPTNNVATATGLTIGAITLDNTFTGSVTMSGSNTVSGATTISGGTLNLNNATGLGTSAVTINSGGTAAINVGSATVANAFSGAGILNTTLPSAANSLTLSGDLSGFTGTLNVGIGSGGGKLVLSNATQAPSSSATINVATNGTLYVFNALNYGSSLILNGGTTGEALGQLRIEGGANWTGGVTLNANSSVGANTGTATISGVIGENGGSFGFNKQGAGTTVISGNNTYSGTTTISGGTLSVGHNNALGTGSVAFNGNTGTLANTTNITLANNLSTASGSGNITASGGTMVINGNITGDRGLTLTPTNKITLAGTNSFATATGGTNTFYALIVNAGAGGVDITGSTTVGTAGAGGTSVNGGFAMVGTSTVTLQSGGSLTVNGSGTTTSNIPNSIIGQNATGTSTLLVNGGSLTIGADTGFVLGNGNNNNIAANGVLTISSGTATINRGTVGAANGTDTRLISMGRDSNSATGTINLNGGTLATNRQFVRDGSSTTQSGTANFVFGGGTLKALGNQTDWLQSTTATSGGQGGGTVNASALALSSVTTTSAASTIDSNGFSVAINNAITGSGGFHIISSSGNGTVHFGGASYAYTGATSVDSGTLNTNAASVTFAGAMSVAGGTLAINGAGAGTLGLGANAFTMTLGTLSYSLGDQITGTGSFGISGGTLDLTNSISDYGIAYTLFNGFTSGSVSGLSFTNYDNTNWVASLDTDGVLTFAAIPEPSTYAALAGMLALGAVITRRRNRQA